MGHYGAEDSTSVTPVRGSLTDLSPKWDEVARGDEPQKCSQGPIVTPSPPPPPPSPPPPIPPSLTSVSQPHRRLTSLSSGPIYESQVRSKSSAAILPHNSEPRNTKRGWGRRWGDSGGNVLVTHTHTQKEVHAVCVFLSIFFLFFLLNYEEFTMAI